MRCASFFVGRKIGPALLTIIMISTQFSSRAEGVEPGLGVVPKVKSTKVVPRNEKKISGRSLSKTDSIKDKFECSASLSESNSLADMLMQSDTVATKINRDGSCYVSLDAISSGLLRHEYTLIDVRNEQSFGRYWIAGAMNIPAYEIKTKGFLRHASLLLLDEGRSSLELESTCAELKSAGFSKVAILRGGLNAWEQKYGNLSGDVIAQKQLKYMTPREFDVERQNAEWLVLDATGMPTSSVKAGSMRVLPLGDPLNANKFLAAIKPVLNMGKRNASKNPERMLVVTRKGDDYEVVDALMKRSGAHLFYFLAGGADGYERYLSETMAIAHRPASKQLPYCGG